MSRLVVTELVSIDGVFEAPENWAHQFFREEDAVARQYKFDELVSSDALLLGRVTYEGFAGAFPPQAGDEFADRMNSVPKYVVSTTLENPAWNNSQVIRDNVAGEIINLKERYQQDIVIHASGDLISSLMPLGLIDEYRLMVFPIVLGRGKRLFKDGADTKNLTLAGSKVTGAGVVILTYKTAGTEKSA